MTLRREWPEGPVYDRDGKLIGEHDVCYITDYFVVECMCSKCKYRRGEE